MVEPLTFSVFGTPHSQPRPRFVKGRVISTASPKVKLWRDFVERSTKAALALRGGALPAFLGPVRVRMIFTFEPPKAAPGRIGTPHTMKPDADNLAKLIMDVMERAGVFKNDSQASAAPPEKWWGARAGVSVVVESMEGEVRCDPRSAISAPDWL